jgi:ribosomal protein S18 acetylase RimI-like enzyme
VSAALTLGKPEHLAQLLPLCEAFHAEESIASTDETRAAALSPLLEGSPYGAVYIIGPVRAPIGYVVICFGWSVEFGGLDAIVDEIYVRPNVRGRGIATEALTKLPKALGAFGLRAIHLEVSRENEAAVKLYQRAGFTARDHYMFMSRVL